MFLLYSILGLAVGSFLNVCIDRLPQGQSILYPPSHCPECKRPIALIDIIPVVSYLMLRGRCRYCGSPIPRRVPLVEAGTGVLFGVLWLWLGPGLKLALASSYASVMVVITVIDLEHRLILNKIIFPAIALAPIASLAYGRGVRDILLGGLVGFALMLLPYLGSYLIYGVMTRGGSASDGDSNNQEAEENDTDGTAGFGFGDVKLGAFIGLASGFPSVFIAVFAAVIVGGITALFLLLTGLKGRKDPIPFAPFLVMGATVAFVWGDKLVYWYVGLL